MSTDQVKIIGDIAIAVEKLIKENPNIEMSDICIEDIKKGVRGN